MGTTDWTPNEIELRSEVLAGRTVVVNRRKSGPHARLWAWADEEGLAVYVGRADPWGRWPASPWANPHRGESDEVLVALYREYLEQRPELVDRLPELKGKVLGCWCAPEPCHAQVLADRANGES